jgi:hypothetical protein
MTDHHPPLTDDELSAHLDGIDDGDVADRLGHDEAGRERLERLDRARRALAAATVEPVAPEVADRLVVTALASDGADVVPLAPRLARRAGPPGWAVAAVVAVLLGIGLTLVWQGRNADDQQAASGPTTATDEGVGGNAERSSADLTAPEVAKDAAGTDSLLPDHGAPTEASPTTVAPAPGPGAATVALGTFPGPDALRESLATAFPTTSATTVDPAPTEASLARCAKQMRLTLSLDADPTHQGWATVDGEQVLVYEFPSRSYTDGSPTTLVTAVGAEACDQVAIFQR